MPWRLRNMSREKVKLPAKVRPHSGSDAEALVSAITPGRRRARSTPTSSSPPEEGGIKARNGGRHRR